MKEDDITSLAESIGVYQVNDYWAGYETGWGDARREDMSLRTTVFVVLGVLIIIAGLCNIAAIGATH